MNYSQHIAAAETFLRAEELLSAAGMDMAAAEMLWGAAVQAIDAASHQAGGRHSANNRARERLVGRLDATYSAEAELNAALKPAIYNLHNHFYTGRLGAYELSLYLVIGRAFARRMVDLLGREPGQ